MEPPALLMVPASPLLSSEAAVAPGLGVLGASETGMLHRTRRGVRVPTRFPRLA